MFTFELQPFRPKTLDSNAVELAEEVQPKVRLTVDESVSWYSHTIYSFAIKPSVEVYLNGKQVDAVLTASEGEGYITRSEREGMAYQTVRYEGNVVIIGLTQEARAVLADITK